MKKIILIIILIFVSKISAQQKPNILFISIDDLADYIAASRDLDHNFLKTIYPDKAARDKVVKKLTPTIDKLAANGRQYVNAMCQSPLCGPSRTALMTGVPAHTSGYFLHKYNFRTYETLKNRITLPQRLKQNGYYTVGIGKIFHKPDVVTMDDAGDWPDARYSWDEWVSGGGGASLGNGHLSKWSPKNKGLMQFGKSGLNLEATQDFKNSKFTADLLEFGIAKRFDNYKKSDVVVTLPKGKPFFLASGIFRPHLPFFAPKKYFDLFPIDEMKIDKELFDAVVNDISDLPYAGKKWTQLTKGKFYEVISQGEKLKGEEGKILAWKHCVQAYLACVAFADDCVKEILSGLEKSAYKNNTIVILWSDHGYFLGDKARIAKQCLWREALNCNLIISSPFEQKSKGTPSFEYVQLTDLYPTILSLTGIDIPKNIIGIDISQTILSPTAKLDREYLYSTYQKGNNTLYNGKYKFIKYSNGDEEFYNLVKDPKELNNLAGKKEWIELLDKLDKKLVEVLEQDKKISE